jgi:TolB protein
MRLARFVPIVAGLGLLAPLVLAPLPAEAAFPGRAGLIAFQQESPAGDHTQTDILAVRPNGTGVRRLTDTPDLNEFDPAWNAAGTRIAFWRTRAPFGTGAVWTMDADGRHQRQLTTGVDARNPVWNPQGTRLAFALVDASGFHLWSMRARDGGGRRQLTSGPGQDFEPAWSPDGRRIAFTRAQPDGDPGDVYLLDLVTGRLRQLTRSPEYDHQVSWSPDGRRLVFERDGFSTSAIFTINADGSHPRQLTSGAFFDNGPAYSPDGRSIAFGSDRAGGFFSQLFVMRADGTKVRPLVSLPFSNGFPDWAAAPRSPGRGHR